ncbi:hypothetical protein DL96DRAFT_1763213 [Flagelloscypha sp. PMI_526]|nr:hypothetical protein DL96DRAFT_1763213 [Flagelloscypha sp. PMI_526]
MVVFIRTLIILSLASLVLAAIVRIDDTDYAHFQFSSSGGDWLPVRSRKECRDSGMPGYCERTSDAAHGGTFHASTIRTKYTELSGWIAFQGHSIQVFGFRYGSGVDNGGNATMSFNLGSSIRREYNLMPLETGNGPVQTVFFEQSGMSEDYPQTLNWRVETNNTRLPDLGFETVIVVFDYASVTNSKPEVKRRIPAIVGGTVGGFIIVVLIGLSVFYLRRRAKHRLAENPHLSRQIAPSKLVKPQ